MPIFKPSDISNLGFYDDPTKNITNNGDDVSIWGDDSGNGRDVSQGTTSKQPHTGLFSINGVNAIDFEALDDQHLASAAFSSTLSQPITYFVIVKPESFSDGQYESIMDGIDSSDRLRLRTNPPNGTWNMWGGTGLSGSEADTNVHFLVCVWNGTLSKLYVDGVLDASGDAGSNDLSGITIGSWYGGTGIGGLDGLLGHVGFYEKLVSGSELNDLNNWGMQTAGLQVTFAPENPVCGPGDTQNTITFDDVVGKTSFDLWWNTSSPAESGTKITDITSGYIHTGLSNGTTYYYKIFGVNDAGDGALSSEVNGTPSSGPPSEFVSRESNKKRTAINTSIKVWQENMNNN